MTSIMIINIGVGLAYGAIPMLLITANPPSETAAANSLNTLIRSLGTSGAATVTGVLLATITTTAIDTTVPTETAFQIALIIGGSVALLALAIIMFLPRPHLPAPNKRRQAEQPGTTVTARQARPPLFAVGELRTHRPPALRRRAEGLGP